MFRKLFKKKDVKTPSKDDAYGKLWLEALEERFGEVTVIKEVQCPDKPTIYIFYFDALPEKGFLTAITCGLSEARHPDWKFGTPELIVTMESPSYSWGLAAGFFASSFFGEKRFSYGDMFKLDEPISEESEMNAYLLFASSFLDRDQSKVCTARQDGESHWHVSSIRRRNRHLRSSRFRGLLARKGF